MKKIGLFYGTSTAKTAAVAEKIREAFGDTPIDMIPVEKAWRSHFESYDNLIVGSSTWFDGELPAYWDELIPEIETMHLQNKKMAIFGLGDQMNYPDNFADGIGLLADAFQKAGALAVGYTSPEGYRFNRSLALRDGHFIGLVLDFENQSSENESRIRKWVEQLKTEFS